MNFKLIKLDPNYIINTKSSWAIKNNLNLEQDKHVVEIINRYKPRIIKTNYTYWEKYCTTIREEQYTNLMLFAHLNWTKLSCIIDQIEKIQTEYIFVAINKYLILSENQLDHSLSNDYDKAIYEFFYKHLKKFEIIDYRYQSYENGNVGNFISPDNRLLCKIKSL